MTKPNLPDDVFARCVNHLTQTCHLYADSQQLREQIGNTLRQYVDPQGKSQDATLSVWRPYSEAPEEGSFLVLFREPTGAGHIHTERRTRNVTSGDTSRVIGHMFAHDVCRDPEYWAPLVGFPPHIEQPTP